MHSARVYATLGCRIPLVGLSNVDVCITSVVQNRTSCCCKLYFDYVLPRDFDYTQDALKSSFTPPFTHEILCCLRKLIRKA